MIRVGKLFLECHRLHIPSVRYTWYSSVDGDTQSNSPVKNTKDLWNAETKRLCTFPTQRYQVPISLNIVLSGKEENSLSPRHERFLLHLLCSNAAQGVNHCALRGALLFAKIANDKFNIDIVGRAFITGRHTIPYVKAGSTRPLTGCQA